MSSHNQRLYGEMERLSYFSPERVRNTGGVFFPFCDVVIEHPITSVQKLLSTRGAPGGLTIAFKFSGEFSFTSPQSGTVTIYNLAQETKAFARRLMRVRVHAGYLDGVRNTVFTGFITRVENPREGADNALELSVLDNTFVLQQKKVVKSWVNKDVAVIVRDLLTEARIPLSTWKLTGDVVPFYVSGQKPVADEIRDLMDHYVTKPWKFYLRQGSAVFAPLETGFRTSILLSPTTGLVRAVPVGDEFSDDLYFKQAVASVNQKFFEKGRTLPDADQRSILLSTLPDAFDNEDEVGAALRRRELEFESIFHPGITADSIVYVRSFNAQGYYRVKSYTHDFSRDRFRTSGRLAPTFLEV